MEAIYLITMETKQNKYSDILVDAGFKVDEAGIYTWSRPWEKTNFECLEQVITATIDDENPKKIKVVSKKQKIVTQYKVTLNLQHAFLLKLALRKLQK